MINLEFKTSDNYIGKLTNIKIFEVNQALAQPPNLIEEPPDGEDPSFGPPLIGDDSEYQYDRYGIQMYDDESYNLTFQTFDLENLEKRASTYSKTIKIPGTQTNNKIFSHLYDVDVDVITDTDLLELSDDVFFNKKIHCELLHDSLPVKEGFFELKKVLYNEGLQQIEYEGEFYSKAKSFSTSVGDKLIYGNQDITDNIDFSEYDHNFTLGIFVNSHNTSSTFYTQSRGYYYPIIDYVNLETGNYVELEQFRPAIYVKELFDKIFAKAGFTYQSDFLNSNVFKSLIIPWSGEVKLDDDNLEKRNLNVGITPTGYQTDFTGYGAIVWGNDPNWDYKYRDLYSHSTSGSTNTPTIKKVTLNDDTDPFYNSNYNDFNTSTYEWDVKSKGKYKILYTASQHVYGIKWTTTGVAGTCYQQGDKMIDCRLQLYKEDLLGNEHLLTETKSLKYLVQVGGNTWIPTWTDNLNWSGVLLAGEKIYIKAYINNYNSWVDNVGNPVNVRTWLNVSATGTGFRVTAEPSYQLYEGEVVEMNKALPQIKQIDFVKDIINMFNLIVDEMPDNENKLLIEPRDDYYNSGTTLDWTSKEDISQSSELERISTLINKDFKLNYKSDNDDFNNYYQEDNGGSVYGNKIVKNPYLSEETYNVNVNYAPTPLGDYGNTNWIVSKLFSTNDNGEIKEATFQPRILFRQTITGQTLSTVWLRYSGGLISFGQAWANGYNYQPYAGHLDNPYNPTKDLNFDVCNNYYSSFLPNIITSNNIYNSYWKNYVAELMDLNSKKVTKYLKLGAKDIYNLSFSSKIWIDNVLYVLEKINDWNPGKITKVELLKLSKYDLNTQVPDYTLNLEFKKKKKTKKSYILEIKAPNPIVDLISYTGNTSEIVGSGSTMDEFSGSTVDEDYTQKKNVYSESAYGIIIGENNVVDSSDGIFIKGNNNYIKSGTTNISIFSNDVIVEEGVKNVIVLANDVTGKTITESNKVYLPEGYTIENFYNSAEVDQKLLDVSGTTGVTQDYVDDNFYKQDVLYTRTEVDSKTGATLTYVENNYYNTGETFTRTQIQDDFVSTKATGWTRFSKTGQTHYSGTEYIIGDNYSGTGRTIYLSDSQCLSGKMYLIKDELGEAGTNLVAIFAETKTIDGAFTSIPITIDYGSKQFYSDGSNWFTI